MSGGSVTNNGQGTKTSSMSNIEEDEAELRRGPWTIEEDSMLIHYIACNGEGRWNMLAKCAGLKRTGKSCRLRWLNYLKPDVKRGNLSPQEQLLILELHSKWGNRWSKIAQHLPGRTDNEIKNFWRTRVQKQARRLNPDTTADHQQLALPAFSQTNSSASSLAMSAQEHNIIPNVSNMSPPRSWHHIFSPNHATTLLGESSSSSFPQPGVADHHQTTTTTSPGNVITYGNSLYMDNGGNPLFHNEGCYYVDNTHAADASGGFGLGDASVAPSGRRDWVLDDEVANSMWNNTDELWQFR
uniref:Uncharacterized protein n=1 Tax=Kalanchoe fedtschenkoi TaxID=63787 RepID=A0A7N0UG39_KALFE